MLIAACTNAQSEIGSSTLPRSPVRVGPDAPGPTPAPLATASWEQSLFINDVVTVNNGVCSTSCPTKLFKNGTWTANGSFNTSGYPMGLWSDQKYLYVPNFVNATTASVNEYRPNDPSPIFSYSNGLTFVTSVSTQLLGNVHYVFVTGGYNTNYEANFVQQYQRDTNTIIATCYPHGNVNLMGVAVAPNGNVFVDYNDSLDVGHLVEYVGGLAGCNATPLPMTFLGHVTGIALDNAGRLLICNTHGAAAIDVIDPPYTSISGTLGSGFMFPDSISINANNNLAFVADGLLEQVRVLQYPSGALVQTIGTANGLNGPRGGAVEWVNYGF